MSDDKKDKGASSDVEAHIQELTAAAMRKKREPVSEEEMQAVLRNTTTLDVWAKVLRASDEAKVLEEEKREDLKSGREMRNELVLIRYGDEDPQVHLNRLCDMLKGRDPEIVNPTKTAAQIKADVEDAWREGHQLRAAAAFRRLEQGSKYPGEESEIIYRHLREGGFLDASVEVKQKADKNYALKTEKRKVGVGGRQVPESSDITTQRAGELAKTLRDILGDSAKVTRKGSQITVVPENKNATRVMNGIVAGQEELRAQTRRR